VEPKFLSCISPNWWSSNDCRRQLNNGSGQNWAIRNDTPCIVSALYRISTVSYQHCIISALYHFGTVLYRHCIVTALKYISTASYQHCIILAVFHNSTASYQHCSVYFVFDLYHIRSSTVVPYCFSWWPNTRWQICITQVCEWYTLALYCFVCFGPVSYYIVSFCLMTQYLFGWYVSPKSSSGL